MQKFLTTLSHKQAWHLLVVPTSVHVLQPQVPYVLLQTGLRRLVKGEGDFAQVFQKEDQASVHEQIVARVNKYSRQLQERAEKELDHMPFPS